MANVDIRADGGYIVVPPSVHPNGNKYSWKRDFCQQDMACMPEWLLQELIQESQKKDFSEKAFEIKTHPYFSREFSNTLNKIKNCPEGKRNDTLYRGAFKLAQMCHSGYLQENVVKSNWQQRLKSAGFRMMKQKKQLILLLKKPYPIRVIIPF